MSMPAHDPTAEDPAQLSADQRTEELAAILARGLLRLNIITLSHMEDSSQKPLAVSAKQSVHGAGG